MKTDITLQIYVIHERCYCLMTSELGFIRVDSDKGWFPQGTAWTWHVRQLKIKLQDRILRSWTLKYKDESVLDGGMPRRGKMNNDIVEKVTVTFLDPFAYYSSYDSWYCLNEWILLSRGCVFEPFIWNEQSLQPRMNWPLIYENIFIIWTLQHIGYNFFT